MKWIVPIFTVLTLCCYGQATNGDKKPADLVDAIMDIVGRIEGVTRMTVDMANTIRSLGKYSDEKWGFDFFKIQLKTAAIYKKVIEHARRNSEISKIKEAVKDFHQETSDGKVETKMVDKLTRLIDASMKTKILADMLYDIMEPYKYVASYPEDYQQLWEIQRKVKVIVTNVSYVLDTTFDLLNYLDKKTWCSYLHKLSPKREIC